MGLKLVGFLDVKADDKTVGAAKLYHQTGLDSVQVEVCNYTIYIPKEVMLDLVAEEIINAKIQTWESMDPDQVMEMIKKGI